MSKVEGLKVERRQRENRRRDKRLKKFELICAIRGKETFVSFVKNLCESLWLRKKMSNV